MTANASLYDALSPWLGLAFALALLFLIGGILSRALGLATDSRTLLNLEETAINMGLSLVFAVGIIWLLLWTWENVIPNFVENLPGG